MSESQPPADADLSNDGGDASASVPKPMEDRTLDEFDPSLHFQPGSSETSDFMKVTQHGMTEAVSGKSIQENTVVLAWLFIVCCYHCRSRSVSISHLVR